MINLTRIFELFFLIGTAWLSSVRVVECNIKLLNERNLYCKFHANFLLKILVWFSHTLNEIRYYLHDYKAGGSSDTRKYEFFTIPQMLLLLLK